MTTTSIFIFTDPQTGIISGIPESAICVQKFDDSWNSAIHITYRTSLRSSSMREPIDPLLKVIFLLYCSSNSKYNTTEPYSFQFIV